MASGERRLQPGADLPVTLAALTALSGIGDWSAKPITLNDKSIGSLEPYATAKLGLAHSVEVRRGVTMLLVEQCAAAALEVADYGYVLGNGRISVHGPAAQLKNDPAVKAAYLGGSH